MRHRALFVGADPAEHAGLALLEGGPGLPRPSLLWVGPIYGARLGLWLDRLNEASAGMRVVIEDWNRRNPEAAKVRKPTALVELRPPVKQNQWTTAQAIGARRGMIQTALHAAGVDLDASEFVLPDEWAKWAGVVFGKQDMPAPGWKPGHGHHRMVEACQRVSGAELWLRIIEATPGEAGCLVDVAEAILMAYAAYKMTEQAVFRDAEKQQARKGKAARRELKIAANKAALLPPSQLGLGLSPVDAATTKATTKKPRYA